MVELAASGFGERVRRTKREKKKKTKKRRGGGGGTDLGGDTGHKDQQKRVAAVCRVSQEEKMRYLRAQDELGGETRQQTSTKRRLLSSWECDAGKAQWLGEAGQSTQCQRARASGLR